MERHVRLNKWERRVYGELDIRAGLAELRELGAIAFQESEHTPYLMCLTERGRSLIRRVRDFPGL